MCTQLSIDPCSQSIPKQQVNVTFIRECTPLSTGEILCGIRMFVMAVHKFTATGLWQR